MIMRTRALIVATELAIAVGLAAGAAAAPTRAACTPGQSTVNGHTDVTFCGPAKATVEVGGKTYTFKGGSCIKPNKYVNLNIGTDRDRSPEAEEGLLRRLHRPVSRREHGHTRREEDGTYGGGLVVVRTNGLVWDLNGFDKDLKVTLKNGRSAGTFTGSTHFTPQVEVTGSFSW